MSEWKKVKIDFKTIKLGDYIEPIKTTVAEMELKNPVVYGVTNKEGIVQTGKPASKDISNYIVLEENCFAFNPYRVNVGSIGINENNLKGCVSPAYVVFKTKNGLLPKFLFFYLKSDYGIHLINWYGNRGGVRNALRYSDLCNIDIPDIRNINQEILLNKFSLVSENINQIRQEIEKQKSLAKQLRQNILQDAIEGKLTEEWRKNHPVVKGNPDFDAEALFEKIQEEKSHTDSELLRNSKKKEKALPEITEDEKPFEIPEGWKWVRLGEVSESCLGKMLDGIKNQGKMRKYLRNLNVRWFCFDLSDLLEMKIKDEELEKFSARKGDLLICEGGYPGRSAIWNEDYDICFQKAVHRVRFFNTPYMPRLLNLYLFLLSENGKIEKYLTGEGIRHLTGVKLKQILFPLPPLAEQTEIVRVVEAQLTKVDQLEKQIAERETLTKRLMQSILKDAFREG